VYVPIGIGSLAQTGVDPARAALLPVLAKTPQQLTAANALEATVDGAALTLGPAIGGVLLGVASVQAVLAVDGVAAAVAATVALGLTEPRADRRAQAVRACARR